MSDFKNPKNKTKAELIKEISLLRQQLFLNENLQSELERLDRFHLVGQIAAGIGHEIRNPLTTIRGFLQLLSAKDDCLRYEHYFKLMIDELDRANTLIGEFLSLTKNPPANFVFRQLNDIIMAVSPLLTADATLQDKLILLDLCPNLPNLFLNSSEIRQLIFNLVRNALEAIEPEGKVVIRTYTRESEVILSVADNGSGMTPEQIAMVGKPFVSTKADGTGLGLTICHNIATRHHAKITVTSSVKATTFFVHFPIH